MIRTLNEQEAPANRVEIVLFASSFALSGERGGTESPNISHALKPDRSATLCGRTGWMTEEGLEEKEVVDCLRCRRSLRLYTPTRES